MNAIVPNPGSELLLLFDKNVCLCVCFTHFPDELQAESCRFISVRIQRSLEHLQYIPMADVSAVMYRSFVNKTNGSKT